MTPENPNDPTPSPTPQYVHNPLETRQPGETFICEVKRSPVGLFVPYLAASLVIVGAAAASILVPYYMPNLTQQDKLGVLLGAIIAIAATLLYVYITTVIYMANRWIITSDSLTQITQTGLTTTQSSQLSLENLEDVTVEKNGIWQAMLGFGTLRAETAGERSKFSLAYCPDPDACARKLLAAREAWEAQNRK